eukprot:1075402-Rhodomonas_salina.2
MRSGAAQAAKHPLVDQGQPFAHPRPQPRARLNPNHERPAAFPVEMPARSRLVSVFFLDIEREVFLCC